MSDPAPWQCPTCETWLAPHVSEHRCKPAEPAVTVTPWVPATGSGGSGSGGTYVPSGSTVVVTATNGTARDLARITQAMNLTARRQWARYGLRPAA